MNILVAGLSGVGKTAFCKEISTAIKNVSYITASNIQKESNIKTGSNKSNFLNSQLSLVNNINDRISKSTSDIVLIDGHLFIKKSKVPFDVFYQLNLSAIIFIYEEADIILSRRNRDVMRVRPLENEEQLSNSLIEQLEYCNQLAGDLNLPVAIIEPSKQNICYEFSKFVSRIKK